MFAWGGRGADGGLEKPPLPPGLVSWLPAPLKLVMASPKVASASVSPAGLPAAPAWLPAALLLLLPSGASDSLEVSGVGGAEANGPAGRKTC